MEAGIQNPTFPNGQNQQEKEQESKIKNKEDIDKEGTCKVSKAEDGGKRERSKRRR